MRLPNQRRKLKNSKADLENGKLVDTLERLRTAAELAHESWGDTLGLTHEEYQRIRRGEAHVPARALLYAAEYFQLNVESIATANLDFRAVSRQHLVDAAHIPERYTVAPQSRMRTVVNLVSYLERELGWQYSDSLLRKVQLRPKALDNFESEVNLLLIEDIFESMTKSGLPKDYFFRAGIQTLSTNRTTALGGEIARYRNTRELYEGLVAEQMAKFEKNFSYALRSLSSTKAVVESRARQDVLDGLKRERLVTLEGCLYKRGAFASLPGFIGESTSLVHESKCVAHGDSSCIFEVYFPKKRPADFSSRLIS